MKGFELKFRWRWSWILLSGIGILSLGIGIHKSWVLHRVSQSPATAIVVLGGGIQREMFAAQVAQRHPQLPVLISSGSALPCVYRVLVEDHQIEWDRISIDWRAKDTVTNFTATLPWLQAEDHTHVVLVATDGHMGRAGLLAQIVWGWHGITYTPETFPGDHRTRPGKTALDVGRSLAWLILGNPIVSYHTPTEIREQEQLRQATCEQIGAVQLPPEL